MSLPLSRYASDEPASATDAELVRRTLSGERDAFGDLALRHEAVLFGHVRRIVRNHEDAEEIAQEALLRAYRALPQFRTAEPFKPWLLRIATNLALDQLRRRQGRTCSVDDVEGTADEPRSRSESPAEGIQARQSAAELEGLLDGLSPGERAALSLRYGEEMNVREIAETLGKSAGAVKVLLHRAREHARTILKGRESL